MTCRPGAAVPPVWKPVVLFSRVARVYARDMVGKDRACGRAARHGVAVLIAVIIAVTRAAGCGGAYEDTISGLPAEQGFIARDSEEKGAMGCLRQSIETAERLLDDPAVPAEDKERLRQATGAARSSLARYDELRNRGGTQVVIMAGIRTACAGIVADDVVGGFADDVFLIPLALAALTTHILTSPRPSTEELSRAWDDVGRRIGELGTTVEDTLSRMTKPGNVADTGIMAEVFALISTMGLSPHDPDDICRVLASLMDAARQARDNTRKKRIQATQKFHECRHSRHKRRL